MASLVCSAPSPLSADAATARALSLCHYLRHPTPPPPLVGHPFLPLHLFFSRSRQRAHRSVRLRFLHASFFRRSISATTPLATHQSDRPTLHTAANAPPSSRCIHSDPFCFSCILDALSYRSDPSGVDLLAPSVYIRSDPLAYSPFHLLGTPLCSAASSARAPFDKDRASCPRARLASWLPSSPPSTIPRPCIRLYPGYHTAPLVRPLGFPSDPFWRRGSYKRRAISHSPTWLPPTVPEACLATWPLEQSSRPPAA